ncbi:MAG TPA: FliA/WhiG family RNA polymerase sigma factor [Nitrospiraceae bacterium]|jgi:RNA polymerase sigma factor for flagellar operon FliA|nr:FliA/WhiG family RNA polymerase sigma factor [Nitrospiraceae bacterium]
MDGPRGSSTGAAKRTIPEGDRERVIQEFAHVVKAMAHRLAFRLPAYLDAEDLVSVGIIGLMDAMNKYDPKREAKFKTYAEFRIRGAMLDEIRSMDWIPRSVHERIALLQKTYTELLNRLGRPPSDQEVAKELQMSMEELDEFLTRSRGAVVISLDDLGVQDPDGQKMLSVLTDPNQPDPLSVLVNDRERKVLESAIQELPEKERVVLSLYYFEELTMKEIGQALKVTESRVCQIHSKAILHLKARLQPVDA